MIFVQYPLRRSPQQIKEQLKHLVSVQNLFHLLRISNTTYIFNLNNTFLKI